MTPSPHATTQTPLPLVKQNSEESLIIQYTPLQLPSSHPLDPERHDMIQYGTTHYHGAKPTASHISRNTKSHPVSIL
ncbi:hypothetical protein V8C44DRAFT_1048 [Trichoderma aethiopicum]